MSRAKTAFFAAALCLAAIPAFAGQSVPLGPFRAIQLEGGGQIVVRHGAAQSVTLVKGSTEFTTLEVRPDGTLVIEACNDRCPHQYDLAIEIVVPQIEAVAVKGGGAIRLESGFPAQREFDAAIAGGGSVDGRAVSAQSVNAAVNGGGHVQVTANGALNAAVNGGGHILYWGQADVHQAVSGGGSIARGGE
ncbi:MAG: DUF2807 domain-containing protein [Rhizomicrobium sp.]